MASIPTVVDCDPGHDYALAHAPARADLRVQTSSDVAGSEPLDRTTRNVARGLTLLRRTDIPVATAPDRPHYRVPWIPVELHGSSGLDGADLAESATNAESIRDAVVVAWLALPGRVTSASLQVVFDAVGRFA